MAVPKLRFKEFDGDWEFKTYSNVLKIYYGKDHKHLEDGLIPVYGTGGLMRKVNQFLFDGESILIGRKGTIDQPKYVNEKFWTVDTLFYTDIFVDYNVKFIYQHTLNVKWQLLNEATGVPSLNTTNIYNVPVHTPTLPEQTKIATFLTAVDNKIAQLTQKHALLVQYKQGMMQQLFSQQIRFKADDGVEFAEWESKPIYDLAQINPKTGKLPSEFYYIDLESVDSGRLVKEKFINLSDAPSRAQRLLVEEDILFQMVRPYQKNNFHFVNINKGVHVASTGYVQLRTQHNSRYIYYALHTNTFIDEVLNRCTGTSYPAINSNDFSTIELPICSYVEQTKIANFLTAIDQKIEVVAQQIEHAKQWKKGLLQQMFVEG